VINGYLNYYSFVYNYAKFAGWVYKNLRSSCAKLLAAKFNLGSQNKVYLKYGKNLIGKDKVALVKIYYKIQPWNFKVNQIDIIKALYAEYISAASLYNLSCSLCGSKYRVEMHHIRKLADLNPKIKTACFR